MEGHLGTPPRPPDRSTPGGGVSEFSGEGGGVGGRSGASSMIVERMSTEWTDEKHSLYLKSIEASFVNQLYSSNYLLGWASRIQKNQNSLESHVDSLYSAQFKVNRDGCWGEVKFERPWTQTDVQKETCVLLRNPWIQHFRSITSDRMLDSSSVEDMEGDHICNLALHVGGPGNVITVCEEATSSSQLSSCCSCLRNQGPVGRNTGTEEEGDGNIKKQMRSCLSLVAPNYFLPEVSDQNFVVESEGIKQLNRVCKKRTRMTVSDSMDQVVPLGKCQRCPKYK